MNTTNTEEELRRLRGKLSDTLSDIGAETYCTPTRVVIIRTDSYGDTWEEDLTLSDLVDSLHQAVAITEQLIKKGESK